MKLVAMQCHNCGAPLEQSDISEQLAVAKCSHCSAIFSIEKDDDTPQAGKAHRQEVPMPKGLVIHNLGSRLEIVRRWLSPVAIPLVIFCVFWNVFMIVWHSIALSSGAWFMSVFGLIHTGVGIGLAYTTLAIFLNRTTISVDQASLTIQHAPIPWRGSGTTHACDIDQIFCREKISHGKNSTRITYQVFIIDKKGQKKKLLSGLDDIDQALFIEQELERFFKIDDQAVRGEIPR